MSDLAQRARELVHRLPNELNRNDELEVAIAYAAQALRAVHREATETERERCARVCEARDAKHTARRDEIPTDAKGARADLDLRLCCFSVEAANCAAAIRKGEPNVE